MQYLINNIFIIIQARMTSTRLPAKVMLPLCDKTVLEVMESDIKPLYVEERPGEVKIAYCTVGKSKKLLDFQIKHDLNAGLKKMVRWAKKTGPQEPIYTIALEITKKVPKVWKYKMI